MSFDRLKRPIFLLAMLLFTAIASDPVSAAFLDNLKGGGLVPALVNALVIVGVAFVVLAVAKGGGSNNNIREILVYAAIGLGAFFIFLNKYKGTYLWKIPFIANIFHMKVLVNILVAAAFFIGVFMLAQMFIPALKNLGDKNEKYLIYGIIALISIYISLSPMYEDGQMQEWDDIKNDYTYVWHKETVIRAQYFLLGNSECHQGSRRHCYTEDMIQSDVDELRGGTYEGRIPHEYECQGNECFWGILVPPNIFVAVFAFAIMIWLFDTFKFIDQTKWIKYFLAFVIATQMANAGMSIETFAGWAQIVAAIIIVKMISGQIDIPSWGGETGDRTSKIVKVLVVGALAITIPCMIAEMIAPKYALWDPLATFGFAPEYVPEPGEEGEGGGTTPSPSVNLSGFSLQTILFLAIGLYVLRFLFTQRKRRWVEKLRQKFVNGLKTGGVSVANATKAVGVPEDLIQSLTDRKFMKPLDMPDEIPSVFKKLNVELQVLMNYVLRFQVYNLKHSHVKATEEKVKDLIKIAQDYMYFSSLEQQFREMEYFKTGNQRVVQVKKGEAGDIEIQVGAYKAVRDGDEIRYEFRKGMQKPYRKQDGTVKKAGSEEEDRPGFINPALHLFNILKYTRDAFNDTDYVLHGIITKDTSLDLYNHKMTPRVEGALLGDFTPMCQDLNEFLNRRKRYGNILEVEANKLEIFDQYLMAGAYTHYYQFAHPAAPVYKVPVTPESFKEVVNNPDQPWPSDHSGAAGKDGSRLWEVNRFGYFTDDINKALESGTPSYVRRVRRWMRESELIDPAGKYKKAEADDEWVPTIVDASFVETMRHLEQEWQGWIYDLRYGIYHPYSKTFDDYEYCHRRKDARYHLIGEAVEVRKKVSSGLSKPTHINPAFDREALKDSGNFVYWGRKKWYDDNLEHINNDPVNPYPGVSAYGISKYIANYAEEFMRDKKLKSEHLDRYQYASNERDKAYINASEIEEKKEEK